MKPRRIAGLAATLICLAVAANTSALAQAVRCGDTLYASVALTNDVVCGPGADAIIIGDNKVRIDLNGFNITGPYTAAAPTRPATGILSIGFEHVQIVGPGRITGFYYPVDIDGGNNHRISGIEAIGEEWFGVYLSNSSGSVIESSRLSHVTIFSDPGLRATANRVVNNEVGPIPGRPSGAGIGLGGCNTADNVVAYNIINPDDSLGMASWHYDGAHGNQVLENKITRGRIWLQSNSENLIARNTFDNTGAWLTAVQIGGGAIPKSLCRARGTPPPASRNIVRDNLVRGGQVGVGIDGVHFTVPATGNVVTGNTFTDQARLGLFFGQDARSNDARGNTYVNVPQAVLDWGVGNLWP